MCEHKRQMTVYAKADDRQCYRVPHLGIDHDGYAPHIDNLCGGDDVKFKICLDCGTVIGFNPITDEELQECIDEA